MGKKLRKAVKRLSKDLDGLREENRDLAERMTKALERQEETNRALIEILEAYRDRLDQDTRKREYEEEPVSTEDGTSETAEQGEGTEEPEDGPEVTEAAERKARELGVDLNDVKGTGSGGRILVRDVEEAAG